MPWVVFLRAVNVGGHQKFQPSLLARKLAAFDIVNIGAAGTFVVRKPVSQCALRDAILGSLSFKPELMICDAREVKALVEVSPFAERKVSKDVRQLVTVMQRPPRALPQHPIDQPPAGKWQVRILAIHGRFAPSLWRPAAGAALYPNAVIEKQFGLRATTRSWRTILTVCKVLAG
jgi:uncharacterized protein (DUF1697 family)